MKKLLCLLILSVLFMSACAKSDHEGLITMSGAFALYPMVLEWARIYSEAYTNVEFDISAGGAGKGMVDVMSGMVDIAMISREIKTEEAAKGIWWIAVARDAVLVTVNSQCPVIDILQSRGITVDELKAIFIEHSICNWNYFDPSVNEDIHVYTRADSCGAAGTFAAYFDATQDDLVGIGVSSDPGILNAVLQDKLGIGYNNLNYLYDPVSSQPMEGALPFPLDLNGDQILSPYEDFYSDKASVTKAISDGIYPSPPARDLYLVCQQIPTNQVIIDFLTWVLTEGQNYAPQNGYVSLPSDKQEMELSKLEP